jgi:hypothetical protein
MRTYTITLAVTNDEITEDKIGWLLEEAGTIMMITEKVSI